MEPTGKSLTLLLLLLTLSSICAAVNSRNSPESKLFPMDKRATRFCGSTLTNMLKKLCNNCYNKRSSSIIGIDNPLDEDLKGLKELESAEFSHPRAKRQMGVVDRCCVNSCTFDDLKAFCCDQ